jgi:hypothetical protein
MCPSHDFWEVLPEAVMTWESPPPVKQISSNSMSEIGPVVLYVRRKGGTKPS